MTDFAFNGTTVNFDGLPQASKDALLSRVAGHFNNEAASARIGWARQRVAEGLGNSAKAADVSTSDAKNYTDSHVDDATAFVKNWYATKLQALLDGTLGVRASGGSIDPLESVMHRIARQEVRQLLGDAFPKGKDGKATTTYVAPSGNTYVGAAGGDALVALWLGQVDKLGNFGKAGEANKTRIERLAQRELRAKAEAANKRASAEEVAGMGF